jgi:surface polysaccharide O-acyltransferase-like enzyme
MEGTCSVANIVQGIKEVFLFRQEFHLYYLQIMIIVYAWLPIVRIFVRHAPKKELQYGLCLWFLLGILYPTVKNVWPLTLLGGISRQWMLNMTYAAIGYGILGYYLKRYPVKFRWGAIFAAMGFSGTFFGTILMSGKTGTLYQSFF